MTNGTERIPAVVTRRPVHTVIVLTVVWHVLLFALDGLLPRMSGPYWPDLGATVFNVVLFAATLGLVLTWRMPERAGLIGAWPDRRWLLALPFMMISAGYATSGLEGGTTVMASTMGFCLSVGLAEELLSRGVNFGLLRPLGPWPACVLTGLFFGLGHALSALWFSRPLWDSTWQVLTTAILGFALAALRLHVVTIWPLVLIHAVDNFLQFSSPGAAADWWQVSVAGLHLALGVLLLVFRPSGSSPPETPGGRQRAVAVS